MSVTISRRFTSDRLPQPNPPSTRESLSCRVGQWQRVNLVQYSLIGGVDPAKALSVTLDVGTDNENLLNDHILRVLTLRGSQVLYLTWTNWERIC